MENLERLGGLLFEVERASEGCAGAIRVHLPEEPEPVGVVMGEGGRICWATSKYYALRLTDLVASESGRSREELEEIFHTSRATAQPLCELLVEVGVLSEERLRWTLLRQTASALAALVGLALDRGARFSEFTSTNGRSYHPAFTFSASELLAESITIAYQCESAVGQIPQTYSRLANEVAVAMCLLEIGSEEIPAIPVATVGAEQILLQEAITIYRSAKALVRPPALRAAEVFPFANLILIGDAGWLVAYLEPHLCLFQVRSQAEYVRLLSSFLKETRASEN